MTAPEQIAWATGTAIFVAFFTTVVAQYLFAPTLEARKQRLLARSDVTAAAVSTVRKMYLQLQTLRMKQEIMQVSVAEAQRHVEEFQKICDKFDAAYDLNDAALKPAYVNLASTTQYAAEILSIRDSWTPEYIDPLLVLLRHCIGALDPVNLPATRAYHCWLGRKAWLRVSFPSA
ncbi:hypothetical protein [Pseudarthrobacter sp. MEB009]|uniref:hypothetical protein n=1 Tax=Pseudarthrobacter sp. MEB009 TaxID=3040326 RepID=UPI002553E129|nr:hypothetical protein [Pseudarthrobacter sp. MEB009]